MSSRTTRRAGPKMTAVAQYVAAHDGCTKQAAALAVGPSQRYGYEAVNRALRAGLVTAEQGKRGYALHAAGE